MMNDFQELWEKILLDHKEHLKRGYYNATGEFPEEEMLEKAVTGIGNNKVEINPRNEERHEAVMELQRNQERVLVSAPDPGREPAMVAVVVAGRTNAQTEPESVDQSPWSNLPPELLLDIIQRVEESQTTWPARAAVVFCAAVCRSWREITKEIVKNPEQCGRLTFPISLKQVVLFLYRTFESIENELLPGPRESPIRCYIRRDRATSTYLLFHGLMPSKGERDKLLLAARKFRRATCTDFVVSMVADEFSRASHTSNFFGTKFTIYDSQSPCDWIIPSTTRSSRRSYSKQAPPKLSSSNCGICTITYELNVLRTRGPRRMHCVLHSIPVSAIQEGGTAPTPVAFGKSFEEQLSSLTNSKGKEPVADTSYN
ncbi:Tubby-like F-box protein 2 [Hibiscus syriacus]|uniref:Tubby-like F-box protein 2 n=1 Tax=Hibiscus syriacus TaxID=106335 RepID=A0A6A3CEJ8_HIBSY|nr:Tubby-like F-box protein 2 [Hibiscus syriacus]